MVKNASQPDRRRRTSGQIIYPARAVDRVHFPADFGQRYTVFVYVQESFSRDVEPGTEGLALRHLAEFQRMAEAHGVIPTYLINYTCAMRSEAQDVLGPIIESGYGVLGAQLHPWLTPPYQEIATSASSYAGNLDKALEQGKIENLTEAISTHFGQRPVIYRAGRYGIGPNTAELLGRAGYRMDVSVRPRFDYGADGGPNFLRHDARPYWVGSDQMLIELPVGACFTGAMRRFGVYFSGSNAGRQGISGALARTNALHRVALTPEDMPVADVKQAIRVMLRDRVQSLNFAMHAPSLQPGHTPYVKNSADLNALYRWWEEIFGFLSRRKVKPIAADAIIAAAWATR